MTSQAGIGMPIHLMPAPPVVNPLPGPETTRQFNRQIKDIPSTSFSRQSSYSPRLTRFHAFEHHFDRATGGATNKIVVWTEKFTKIQINSTDKRCQTLSNVNRNRINASTELSNAIARTFENCRIITQSELKPGLDGRSVGRSVDMLLLLWKGLIEMPRIPTVIYDEWSMVVCHLMCFFTWNGFAVGFISNWVSRWRCLLDIRFLSMIFGNEFMRPWLSLRLAIRTDSKDPRRTSACKCTSTQFPIRPNQFEKWDSPNVRCVPFLTQPHRMISFV